MLFPRDQTFFEMNQDDSNAQFQYCLNPDLQQEFDMSQSTFDSFQGLSAFAPTEQAYFETPQLVVNGPRDTLKQPHQRYTPLASPSLSASHSLDHAPSNLSHNSGTSGQSTASSAVGSPYSHTTHSLPGQEPWMNPPHGLGIAPGIVHNEYGTESFTFQGEGDQLNYDNVKFPDSFVGEFNQVSSSSNLANSPVMSSPISYSSSSSMSQSLVSAVPSPNLALDTAMKARSVTIDTILEEMAGNNHNSGHMASPVPVASPSAPATMRTASVRRSRSPEQAGLACISPTTPASAMAQLPGRNSHTFIYRPESRKRSIGSAEGSSVHQGSPPVSKRPAPTPISPNEAYRTQFQSPFFSQSSGRFVAPLQSSCWFPYASFPLHFMRHSAENTLLLSPISSFIFYLLSIDANSDQSDPSLIQPYDMPAPPHATPSPYQTTPQQFHPAPHMFQPPSPALSDASSQDSYRTGSRQFRSGNQSPYLHNMTYQPYPPPAQGRRPSVSSLHSRYSSHGSPRSASLGYDEEGKERCRCPNPDCGRYFKDLKAHMLTHQSERPEKCPIVTCEYHQKGFARKYDKNRHTLTHYKGTMVCGFCPGGGSPAEKSFNRADVFKRHLTSVHGVEQTAPNSRKKSPGLSSSKKSTTSSQEAAGKCSTCSAMFNNAQDLYNHLDDCIYAQLENEEPSEAINERRLAEVANDKAVHETLDRNMVSSSLPSSTESGAGLEEEDEEEDDDDVDEDANDSTWTGPGGIGSRSGKGGIKSTKRNNNNNSS